MLHQVSNKDLESNVYNIFEIILYGLGSIKIPTFWKKIPELSSVDGQYIL